MFLFFCRGFEEKRAEEEIKNKIDSYLLLRCFLRRGVVVLTLVSHYIDVRCLFSTLLNFSGSFEKYVLPLA